MDPKDLNLPSYRPSGAVHMSIVPATLAALAIAAVVGIIYGVLSTINPFVIVDVFLVFGLGFGAGVIGKLACHYAHCRNRLISVSIAIALGVVALGASYWIDFTLDRRQITRASTATFKQWVNAKKEAGWVIKGGQINGPFVLIVWGCEAFFVLGLASLLGWQSGQEPYCEQCRAWPKSHRRAVKGHTADEFWNAARAGTPLAILQLPKAEQPNVSLVLDGMICEKCHSGFLSVDEESVKTENGKTRTVRKPLVQAVLMDSRHSETFLAAPPEATS